MDFLDFGFGLGPKSNLDFWTSRDLDLICTRFGLDLGTGWDFLDFGFGLEIWTFGLWKAWLLLW
jgi:hypothetical protein